MKLNQIGEFGLIELIKKKIRNKSKKIVKGIGDDSAVIDFEKNNYLLFTTDALVENVHFSTKYFSPKQIGMKSIEQNASDIAAMGGLPKYALFSIFAPKNIEVDFIDKLYDGIISKCDKYNLDILGGNISNSTEIIVNMSLIGLVGKKYLALRSGAKIGDLIFCTGTVGKSAAGLELLKKNLKGKSIKHHLEPRCRLDLARKLVKIGINSMIDISDGLASEISHICKESKVGAIIHSDPIPISKATIEDSKKIKKNPIDLALYGGEDYELVFTASRDKLHNLKKLDIRPIGEIVDEKYEIRLIKDRKKMKLKKGFDHFR